MNSKFFILSLVTLFFASTNISHAQDDAATEAKLQFSSLFLGATNNFETLKGEQFNEDENWIYYGSDYGLGNKAVTVLHSKKDSTEWYCYIQFSIEEDVTELIAIQTGVFEMLNMVVNGGKIRGEDSDEGETTRTDLYATNSNSWIGELVTDSSKKTFHILLKNTNWQ